MSATVQDWLPLHSQPRKNDHKLDLPSDARHEYRDSEFILLKYNVAWIFNSLLDAWFLLLSCSLCLILVIFLSYWEPIGSQHKYPCEDAGAAVPAIV